MLNDHDPAQVRSAIRREGLALLAHGLLLPFGFRRERVQPERRPDLRTLVFVHGLATNRSSFLALQAWLRLRGYTGRFAFGSPSFTSSLSFNYRSSGSLEGLALQLKRAIDEGIGGGRIDLVAHSMGGLVARFYLQQLGGARRVDRLITLGTPHQGTHAANFVPAALVRQLLPDSPFLRRLNALPAPEGVQVTSIVAGRDLLIQPVEAACCPFGASVRFEDFGHVELLFRPEVFAEIEARLRAPGRRPLSAPWPPADRRQPASV